MKSAFWFLISFSKYSSSKSAWVGSGGSSTCYSTFCVSSKFAVLSSSCFGFSTSLTYSSITGLGSGLGSGFGSGLGSTGTGFGGSGISSGGF